MAVVRVLLAAVLLGLPVLVAIELPRLLGLAEAAAAITTSAPEPAPTPVRLSPPTPTLRPRFSPLDPTPPPTLEPPAGMAAPTVTPPPAPSGEQVVITNTGGRGAILRAEPVTGQPVAALHEQQVVAVLEHRTVPGSGDWLHVQTADGTQGWVTSLVTRPAPTPTPHPPPP